MCMDYEMFKGFYEWSGVLKQNYAVTNWTIEIILADATKFLQSHALLFPYRQTAADVTC